MAEFDAIRKAEMYHFFIIAFNGAPGTTYLGQLQAAVEVGMTTAEIVEVFTHKQAFLDFYPPAMGNLEFATLIVQKVIKTAASPATRQDAVQTIMTALEAGLTRGEVIYNVFGNLAARELDPEQPGYDPDDPYLGVAQQFANQIKVAQYFTEVLQGSSSDIPFLRLVIACVTNNSDVSTPEKIEALINHPEHGLIVPFTTGVDDLVGTDCPDLFVHEGPAASQPGDLLEGFATGADRLQITLDLSEADQRTGGGLVVNLGRFSVADTVAGAVVDLDGGIAADARVYGEAGYVLGDEQFFVDANGNGLIDTGDIAFTSAGIITAEDLHFSVLGSEGADLLRSGLGGDTLQGAAGNDKFVLVGAIDTLAQADNLANILALDAAVQGEGLDEVVALGELVTLRGWSEARTGEMLDGGDGDDVLYVFGKLDLSVVNEGLDFGMARLKLFSGSSLKVSLTQLATLPEMELLGSGEHLLIITDDESVPLTLEQQKQAFEAWLDQPEKQLFNNFQSLWIGGRGTEEDPAAGLYVPDAGDGVPGFLDETTGGQGGGGEGPGQTASIDAVTDNVAPVLGAVMHNGFTNDTTPTLSGTLSAPLAAGESLRIYNGVALLGTAVVNGTSWSFTPPALADGTYNLSARVVDAEQDAGAPSAVHTLTVDTQAPTVPNLDGVFDDVPPQTGNIANGGTTDDTQPTFTGSGGTPGEVITLYENGSAVGSSIVDGDGNWSVTPDEALPPGGYSFTLEASDTAGNGSGPTDPFTLTVGGAGPTQTATIGGVLDDIDPVQGEVANNGHTNDTTPTLSGTLSAPLEAGETLRLYNGATLLGTAVVSGTDWSFTPAALPDGTYHLSARVVDVEENAGIPSPVHTITVDTAAPAVPVLGAVQDDVPPQTGNITNGGTTDDAQPTFTGSGGTPGDVITLYDNGSPVGSAIVDGSGNWSVTPEEALPPGGHSFTLDATDAAGNSSGLSSPFTLTVGSDGPMQTATIGGVLDNVDPVQGEVPHNGSTNDTTPTLSGTLSAPLGAGETLRIYDGATLLGTAVVSGTDWSFTPTALAEGNYNLSARVVDAEEDAGVPSAVRSFTVDTSAPSGSHVIDLVAISMDTGLSDSDFITNDQSLTLLGTLDGGVLPAGETAQISVDGGLVWSDLVVTAGSWSHVDTRTLGAGSHTYLVRVVDAAGNVGSTDSQLVTVDLTAPAPGLVLAITGITEDTGLDNSDFITSDTSLTLHGTLTGGTLGAGEQAQVSVDGGTTWSTVSVNFAGEWSYVDSRILGAGSHTYMVRLSDLAGNIGSTDTRMVTVDTAAPSLALQLAITGISDDTGTAGDFITADNTLTILGTLSGGTLGAGESAQISVDGGSSWSNLTVAAGNWSYVDARVLADGDHVYQVRVVDTAGNVGNTASRTITVDTTNNAWYRGVGYDSSNTGAAGAGYFADIDDTNGGLDRLWYDQGSAPFTGLTEFTRHFGDGRSGDLHIEVNGAGTFHIVDHFAGQPVEQLVFSNSGTYHGYDFNQGGAPGSVVYELSTSPGDTAVTSIGNAVASGNQVLAGRYDTATAETLSGGSGHDLLFGGQGGDSLNGGSGNDLLVGGAGSDQLTGGAGRDVLIGGSGDDTLGGGQDNDIIVLSDGGSDSVYLLGAASNGVDLIQGFSFGSDRLYVASGDTSAGGVGSASFAWVSGNLNQVVAGSNYRLDLEWRSTLLVLSVPFDTDDYDVVHLRGGNTSNANLDAATDGSELLKLLSSTNGGAASGIQMDGNGDELFVMAYDNGRGYLFHADAGANNVAASDEITLVAIFEDSSINGDVNLFLGVAGLLEITVDLSLLGILLPNFGDSFYTY